MIKTDKLIEEGITFDAMITDPSLDKDVKMI